ncbi:MAG: hypothetical protein CVT49_00190 [candidate division Zixibacteria bacterium HGW-Zixibacteria-1]|nr:MAG: hypothetical protein CVT49_00190 [candidate division Zixibacteria bacterium HGW-Zixibacteria-1]
MDLKYNKATDTEHEIKLTSYLISASWRYGAVHAGQKAQVEVLTSFVGNGTAVKITGRSGSGKKIGKLDGKIKNNKFIGEIDIDEDAKIGDDAYFEVDISKAGINGESNTVPILPPIEVINMKWSAAEARRGDILTLSADIKGVVSGIEVKITIYEFDRDKIHDKITEFPATVADDKIEVKWEYEYHEDTDEIASEEELQRYGNNYNPPEYFFVIEIDGLKFGKDQESKLLEFKDWIEIELLDVNGRPVPNVDFEIKMPDGATQTGKLNSEGKVKVENVPPGQFVITYKDIYPQLDVKDAPPPEDKAAARRSPDDGQVTREKDEDDEAEGSQSEGDEAPDSFEGRSESRSSSDFGGGGGGLEEEEPLQG